jgi:hypothetical protein
MFVQFLSDLDYAFNPETGEYDIPAVEWDGEYGKHWSYYESEEARTKALNENQAYNERPEVKAYIVELNDADNREMVYYSTFDLFEHKLETFEKVELSHALQFLAPFRRKDKSLLYLAKLVCEHNKRILKVKTPPKRATFTLGDLF